MGPRAKRNTPTHLPRVPSAGKDEPSGRKAERLGELVAHAVGGFLHRIVVDGCTQKTGSFRRCYREAQLAKVN